MAEKKVENENLSSTNNEQNEKVLTLKSLEKEMRLGFSQLKSELDLLNNKLEILKKVLR